MPFEENSLYASLPAHLKQVIYEVQGVHHVDPSLIRDSIAHIDHTSLSGDETRQDIQNLCKQASHHPSTAAICIYGERVLPGAINIALEMLDGSPDTSIAVVNAFPYAEHFSPEDIFNEAIADLSAGAQELDTVVDLRLLFERDIELVKAKLEAARAAIEQFPEAKLKTILCTSAFQDYQMLYDTGIIALNAGADFLKTSTGKGLGNFGIEKDEANIVSASILMQAVRDFNAQNDAHRGIKISGGVKTPQDVVMYSHLAQRILGLDALSPDDFRIGASPALRTNLLQYLNTVASSPSSHIDTGPF